MLDLSKEAIMFYLLLHWERKYPRRKIKQRSQILEKAKRFAGLWVDDHEIADYLDVDLDKVESVRRELIDNNLITYDTITGVKLDRSMIGYYVIRRMK